jgi:hypothetical protein
VIALSFRMRKDFTAQHYAMQFKFIWISPVSVFFFRCGFSHYIGFLTNHYQKMTCA